MSHWRNTRTPGVHVAHRLACPAFESDEARCNCRPSWRGRRYNPTTGKSEWQRSVVNERSEVLAWLFANRKGAERSRARGYEYPTNALVGSDDTGYAAAADYVSPCCRRDGRVGAAGTSSSWWSC